MQEQSLSPPRDGRPRGARLTPCAPDRGSGLVSYVSGPHEKLVGKWVDDVMDGWGTMLNRNGDRLEGFFVKERLEGLASVFLANGSEFHGTFRGGRMNGHGTYTYGDGSRYVGEFKDDKRNGHGAFSYFSGDRYEGDWVEDKRHGQGTLTFHNDDKYTGRCAAAPSPWRRRATATGLLRRAFGPDGSARPRPPGRVTTVLLTVVRVGLIASRFKISGRGYGGRVRSLYGT